tara:strand:- start:4722 stop:7094 length:2373 start_codon:yes stop_codon:yes gene_type:complete
MLSENLGVLFRVFSFYAKLSSVRALTEASAATGHSHQDLVLHVPEWLSFVSDCQLDSTKLEASQIVELLPQPVGATGVPSGASFVGFLGGLLSLSFWRTNNGLNGKSATSVAAFVRGERRLRPLLECVGTVLKDRVLPLARRDTSQRFRAMLAQDDETQALLKQYRKPMQALFNRLVEGGPGAVEPGLGCAQALDWLEQSGGLGEHHLRLPGALLQPVGQQKKLSSFLTTHLARQAFVDSLPLQLREGTHFASRLGSTRQFQEWLVRCAELKYCALEHLSLAARTHGMLQNVIDGRSTEEVFLQATQATTKHPFDARAAALPPNVRAGTHQLVVSVWDMLDMTAVHGLDHRQPPVFELLLTHASSLVGIFAHYCHSSCSQHETDAIGMFELKGWVGFVMDCHVPTKSFSARSASEVFLRALNSSSAPRHGIDFVEFVQCILQCAFQRTNAAHLQLHEKTAHRLFPVDHCLKAFLLHILPRARRRDVLDVQGKREQAMGLRRMLDEKQDAVLRSLAPTTGVAVRSDGVMPLDAFVASLDRMGLLRDLSIELDVWHPVVDYGSKKGEYHRKLFSSTLRSEDVKQAVVDTVLATALNDGNPLPPGKGVASMPLSPALIMQTIVRLATVMYQQIPLLDLEQRTVSWSHCPERQSHPRVRPSGCFCPQRRARQPSPPPRPHCTLRATSTCTCLHTCHVPHATCMCTLVHTRNNHCPRAGGVSGQPAVARGRRWTGSDAPDGLPLTCADERVSCRACHPRGQRELHSPGECGMARCMAGYGSESPPGLSDVGTWRV